MSDKIVSLAVKQGSSKFWTPKQALESAIDEIGERGAFKEGHKLLVLALDDTNDGYSVSFVQAGMTMSECNNLCDIAKSVFKGEMGYND